MKHISLRFKIMAAFLFLILISALVIFTATSHATSHAFDVYSARNRTAWAERLANTLASYYAVNNTWNGVNVLLANNFLEESPMMGGNMMGKGKWGINESRNQMMSGGMMDDSNQRLVLADADGMVIFDSQSFDTREKLSSEDLDNGTPVMLNDQRIGTILVFSGLPRAGTPSGDFLETMRHSIVASIIAGAVLALILGTFVFNQITAPLRELKKAAAEIGTGNFSRRVSIHSRDELADVGSSFNQMAENLEKAQTARQHYMADIAHELRTPLTAIQGTIEAMQDKILPVDDEQLEVLHGQTTLLNRLINDLRLLSLAEAGQLKLDKSPQKPDVLIRQVVDSLKPLANQKNVSLTMRFDDALPVCELDKDRFTQIMNNLLSNALRYTPESGEISISASTDSEHQRIVIDVTDTGTGINAEDLSFIFDRFYRADKSRSRISGGAGLGLAIVKQLVEAHNGQIQVISPVFTTVSNKGYGTQFQITLPAA
ncbi:MAG: HAMP domain-containing protein [Leptolinea sp.]|jgi:signal transduction histidine kinase|nr:HAMP domain-containing protein [Leptolinea sp.]